MVDLEFPVLGSTLPTDYAYALYASLSHPLKELHAENNGIQIGPVFGRQLGDGQLQLDPRCSRLRLRLPAESIPMVLPLAGKSLDIGGHKVRLGVPQVRALVPAPSLIARLVTIKKSNRHDEDGTKSCMEPTAFLEAVRRQLDKLGIRGEAAIPLRQKGPRAREPRRLVLRVHGKRVVGFAVQVTGLTAEESIKLQEVGLGGKRKMGCGFFVPSVPR